MLLLPNVFPPDEETAFKATEADLISTDTKVKITEEGYASQLPAEENKKELYG